MTQTSHHDVRQRAGLGLPLVVALAISFTGHPVRAQTQADSTENIVVKVVIENVAESATDFRLELDEQHPLCIPLRTAYQAFDQMAEIEGYRCQFRKRELVNGKLIKDKMEAKFREQPFSVYLKCLDKNEGREYLFVEGRNNNKLLVREPGIKAFLGALQIAPGGPEFLSQNRHPITSRGLRGMLEALIKQWEAESAVTEGTSHQELESTLPAGEVCTVYEVIHEKPRKEFQYHLTRLWIQKKSGLAVGSQQFAFPAKAGDKPPIVEEYFYENVNLDTKLSDEDFQLNNRAR